MKRFLIGAVAVLLAVASVGWAVFAAEGAPAASPAKPAKPAKAAGAWAKLTDQQKAEFTDLQNQMFALREKQVDKLLEFKLISPEQAQLMKARLALMKKNAQQNGFGFGMGMGFGPGRRGGGPRGGRNFEGGFRGGCPGPGSW